VPLTGPHTIAATAAGWFNENAVLFSYGKGRCWSLLAVYVYECLKQHGCQAMMHVQASHVCNCAMCLLLCVAAISSALGRAQHFAGQGQRCS